METNLNQRWRARRDSYRPAGEVIRTEEYDVAPVHRDAAKPFVLAHHYSGSISSMVETYGLFRRGELAGVAVFGNPCSDAVLTKVFPTDPRSCLELGRFVLLDEVPGNGETWMLARCFELLRREGVAGVLSFSDPVARTNAEGRMIFPGHRGTIYRAFNGRYLGRGRARTLRVLPDGTVFSERAMSKIRSLERGWKHCAAKLVAHGAAPLEGDPREWLAGWLPRITRPLRHGGNLKYCWAVDRRLTRSLPAGLPYPKILAS